jgi:anti-anti-sigma factor
MQVNRRALGDVVVLELIGDLTRDEEENALLKSIASSLAEGARKFVLNIQGISYIDSTGLGVLVQVYAAIWHVKGSFMFVHPTPRLLDLLTLTKLLTVCHVLPTDADAVAVFESYERGNVLFDTTCPVCTHVGKRTFSIWHFFEPVECVACGVTFRFNEPEQPLVEVKGTSTARLWSMRLPTYQDDDVRLSVQWLGGGCTIGAPRRLDLFSVEVLEKAWFLIPEPRRIVLDVSAIEEFTDRALARLLALGDEGHGADRSVYVTQTNEDRPPSPIASRLIHTGRAHDWESWKKLDLRQWIARPEMPVTITRVSQGSW